MSESLNVYQRLLKAQAEIKAPRSIDGRFGKSRSAERILEAAKPVCTRHGLYLRTSDSIQEVNGRNYVTATATVTNVDKPEEVVASDASAWENDVSVSSKTGEAILDTSQITGKTSSYAKKYALQNLFAIDDTNDADMDDEGPVVRRPAVSGSSTASELATPAQKLKIKNLLEKTGIVADDMAGVLHEDFHVSDTAKMTKKQASEVIETLLLPETGS